MSQDVSVFDDCNLTHVKLYLNSEFYPYDDLNADFGKNRYTILFDMYARFRKAYYGYDCSRGHVSNEWTFWSLTACDKTSSSKAPL